MAEAKLKWENLRERVGVLELQTDTDPSLLPALQAATAEMEIALARLERLEKRVRP